MSNRLLHISALAALLLVTFVPAVAQEDEEREQTLGEVTVQSRLKGVLFGDDVQGRETITATGLTKMACCTVAEAFENSASVTVGYSDAVTGTRQIRLLGLGGNYTQTLDESRPTMRGLGAPYAMEHVPGVWLSSVQVSKGISSVTAGHEAITGQINMEYRKPTDQERLFLNLYLDDMLRPELNLSTAWPLKEDRSFSTILMLHAAGDTEWREMGAMDRDGDHFRDTPRLRNFSLANRWLYIEPRTGMQLRWGVRWTEEDRLGGMMKFKNRAGEREAMLTGWDGLGGHVHYGSLTDLSHVAAYLKAALPYGRASRDIKGEERQSSIALVADFDHFGQDSFFGLNDFAGEDNDASLNLVANHYFNAHSALAAGVQAHFDHAREHMQNRTPWLQTEENLLNRCSENEVGPYAEYTWTPTKNLSLVAGLRADYNSYYDRAYVTPRAHFRWDVFPQTTLRLSAGTGYRTPRVFTDNIGMFATGRQIRIAADVFRKPEQAFTTGASLTQRMELFGHVATLSADYFYTRFDRNIVVDQEYDYRDVMVYASDRHAYSHTLQVDASVTPATRLDVYAAFRLTDSRQYRVASIRETGDMARWVKGERPLVDKYKALLNVQYYLPLRRWVFDATVQLNGASRLPATATAPMSASTHSPAYALLFAQVTHTWQRLNLYLGCENILDYRQKNAIASAAEPFSTGFNSMNVWGPLMGRHIYAGLRLNLY